MTDRGDVECKVRGFTLNMEGSRQLNYEILKSNVKNEVLDPLPNGEVRLTRVTEAHKIVRNHKDYRLVTKSKNKNYGLVVNKRVLPPMNCNEDSFRTYPYGYNQTAETEFSLEDFFDSRFL